MKRLFCISVFAMLAQSAVLAQEVNYYTPGTGEGVVYFLPKTQLKITIVATKTTYMPGDLYYYAHQYLKISDARKTMETRWTLKQIDVQTIGIPDSTKAYIVKLKDRNMASNVELTHNGIVRAINTTAPESQEPVYRLEKSAPADNPKQYLTEEILLAGSKRKMAELTAREIYTIRDSRNNILRGNAETMPKDGASLQLVIGNLDKQEKALTAMFVGTEASEDFLFSYVIEPRTDAEIIPFRFSKHLGALSADNLAGEPYYLVVRPVMPFAPGVSLPEVRKKKPEGIIYNVPGEALVTLTHDNKVVYEQKHSLTQIGATEVLVEKLFDRKINTRVVFNPVTGGIVKIDKSAE